jgi:hypothetical protein
MFTINQKTILDTLPPVNKNSTSIRLSPVMFLLAFVLSKCIDDNFFMVDGLPRKVDGHSTAQ